MSNTNSNILNLVLIDIQKQKLGGTIASNYNYWRYDFGLYLPELSEKRINGSYLKKLNQDQVLRIPEKDVNK